MYLKTGSKHTPIMFIGPRIVCALESKWPLILAVCFLFSFSTAPLTFLLGKLSNRKSNETWELVQSGDDPPQWASTLPILSQKASPLNQALIVSALNAFLPGYTP